LTGFAKEFPISVKKICGVIGDEAICLG